MLTVQQTAHECKFTWCFDDDPSKDLTEFSKITMLKDPASIETCSFYIIGKKELPLLIWKEFLSSLKLLLEGKVKLHFICTSKKIYDWLNYLGVSLLGEVLLDPSVTPPTNSTDIPKEKTSK